MNLLETRTVNPITILDRLEMSEYSLSFSMVSAEEYIGSSAYGSSDNNNRNSNDESNY